MDYLFIVNLTAGGGRAKKIWLKVEKYLNDNNVPFNVFFTTGPGYAEKIALSEREKYKVVAAVGGDGTVCEVVNGIIGSRSCLAVIPAGSGNDFIKSLGIPKDPIEAVKTMIMGRHKTVDLAKADHCYFVNIASYGFDAEVVKSAGEAPNIIKPISYLYALFKCVIKPKVSEINITIDGIIYKRSVLFVAIANGRYYGGGMMVAPAAEIDDGLLDIILVNHVNSLEIIRFFPKVFTGKHIFHPKVEVLRGKEILVSAMGEICVQMDGELLDKALNRIKVMPRALKVIF